MRVTQISLSTSRTFNLGSFESLRVEGGAIVEIAEDDDIGAARAAALSEIRQMLIEQHQSFKPKTGA